MSGIQERLAALFKKSTGADRRLASIADERASLAIEAAMGSKTSLRRIAELDQEEDELKRSKSVFTLAADALDSQLKEQEAEAVKLSAAERDEKARKIGASICAVQSEIDLMLVQLREAFERREQQINNLHRSGGIDSRTAFRLASRENATAAAYFARLNRFLNLEPMGPAQTRALSESNRIIPTPKDGT